MSDLAAHDTTRPWERGWTYVAPGEWGTLAWIATVHAIGLAAPFVAPHPRAWVLVTMTLLAWSGGFATSVGYHRILTHRAARVHPAVEQLFIAIAMWSGYGTPLTWVANHRQHHRASDTLEDVHSPVQGGLWWAQLRWLWQGVQADPAALCPDLAAQARYAAWRRVQVPIAIATVVVWLPFGLDALCWIGGVRILWGLHAMAALNSLCHAGSRPGARDRSRNLAWLGLVQLGVGENWHGNHHDDPASARIGWTWWQVDLGYWLLIALQRVRLASNVRPPRAARRAPAAVAR